MDNKGFLSNQFLFIISTFIIFCIMFFIFNHNVLTADDLQYYFLTQNPTIHEVWFNYGSWVMPFQNIALYVLPYKLGIHFQSWCCITGSLLKAISMAGVFICIFYSLIIRKIKYTHSSILSFIALFSLFVCLSKTHYTDFLINEGFFRFIFPSCLMIFCLCLLYRQIFYKKNNLLLLCILSFMTAYSSEIVASIMIFISFILLMHKILNFSHSNKSEFIPFVIIFISSLSGLAKLVLTYGFKYHFETKVGSLSLHLNSFFSNLPEFFTDFCSTIIFDYWIFWVLFIILFIINIRLNSHKDNLFASLITMAVLVSAFSLVLLGKTHYQGGFWIKHLDIYTFYISAGVYSLILLFIPTIKIISEKNYFGILLFISLIPISLLFVKNSAMLHERIRILEDYAYLRDKMVAFYAYSDLPLVFPLYTQINNVLYYNMPDIHHINQDTNIEEEYMYDLDEKDGFLEMFRHYYPISYNINISPEADDITILPSKEAMEYFFSKGGKCDEIYNRSYKFENLRDKDFVLNTKNK